MLASQGWDVHREFYYNDAGVQIATSTLSTQARARGLAPGRRGLAGAAYNGEYIADIAQRLSERRRRYPRATVNPSPARATSKTSRRSAVSRSRICAASIDPRDTRRVVALALAVCDEAARRTLQPMQFGVARP